MAEHLAGRLKRGILVEIAALGIKHLCLSFQSILEALAERLVFLGIGSHAPCAGHVDGTVGHRTDERYLAFLGKRKHFVLVLQEHERLGGYGTCGGTVLSCVDVAFLAGDIVVFVRVIEESETILGLKHTAHSLVDVSHRDLALVEALLESTYETERTHVHVGTGLQGAHRSIGKVFKTMYGNLAD